jgi:predicted enzyme related to lactoylglutathione lyase
MSSTTAPTPTMAITWFEIPVADLTRAQNFYEAVLEAPLKREVFAGENIAIFPAAPGATTGCLVETAHPSPHGTVVYLNVTGRIDRALELAAAHGGRVDRPKTELPSVGYVAHIIDAEGNRVGLHAKT